MATMQGFDDLSAPPRSSCAACGDSAGWARRGLGWGRLGIVACWRCQARYEASARIFVNTDSILKP
jgi:hypothetical protein